LAVAHDDLAAHDRGHRLAFGLVALERGDHVLAVQVGIADDAFLGQVDDRQVTI